MGLNRPAEPLADQPAAKVFGHLRRAEQVGRRPPPVGSQSDVGSAWRKVDQKFAHGAPFLDVTADPAVPFKHSEHSIGV